MDWKAIWMNLFGTMEFAGLNMGFWVSMGVVALIVVLMNVAFWCMPKKRQIVSGSWYLNCLDERVKGRPR